MNYLIENNIDFFAELNKNDNSDSDSEIELIHNNSDSLNNSNSFNNSHSNNNINSNKCLIYHDKLTDNYITLECGHSFNYLPLYKEIINQKNRYFSKSSIKLKFNEIFCPYCRKKHNYLLPYIPIYKDVIRIKGVNSPDIYCMKYKKCNYTFKNGKNKGLKCNCNAFITKFGILCNKHYNNCIKIESNKQNDINIIWTTEMEQFSKKYTIPKIKEILKQRKLKLSGNKKTLILRLFK